ncbi:MAG: ASKHA domain-containing protein [Thermoguttaceae bacterium]|jgi:uncharacterized 2Fe-2S/4Fe-4S cluster protein (DUF4445 family)
MQEARIPVTFEPGGKTVHVLPGTRLIEAAAEVGLVLAAPCGGEGKCGKCRVRVAEGSGQATPVEIKIFSVEELAAGWRLACQTAVDGPLAVEVPPTSLVGAGHQILVAAPAAGGPGCAPGGDPEGAGVVQRRYVELPAPARGDDDPDLVRLEKAFGPLEAELELLQQLPDRLRQSGFRGTAVASEGRLLDFEPGPTEGEAYAAAVDLGTTTLVAALVDLATGRQAAIAARLNPQARFGDDVLARIVYAQDRPEGLAELQHAAAAALDEMIGQLCQEAGAPRDRVYTVTVSGNTTMQQLLAGIDPRPLGQVPFVPAIGRGLLLPARSLGLHVHRRAYAYLLPVIGGFVGGDTVAGILATGLADCRKPTLFVDIGTNGEIVLVAGGKLTAASTAAGPAFEGARISQGMRAANGAIEKVQVDSRLRFQVIGNVPPVGLCGSALIDAAAELLRHGILTPQGRLRTPGELPAGVLPDLVRRIVPAGGQAGFLLADEEEAAGGRAVLLTQQDIRELQLAAGAIRAGVDILLRRAGLRPDQLDQILIGGGFGNFIRRSNAQRIGLLPPGIEHCRIRFQGNTSLAGARLVARWRAARDLAEGLAARTEHVDLSFDPDFHAAFAEAMIFPEGETVSSTSGRG